VIASQADGQLFGTLHLELAVICGFEGSMGNGGDEGLERAFGHSEYGVLPGVWVWDGEGVVS
jgi:hypothetical protein